MIEPLEVWYFERKGEVIKREVDCENSRAYQKYVHRLSLDGWRLLYPHMSDADQELVNQYKSNTMNAKKQSTVKSVTGAGTYKEFFSFEYTMEDGTILKANHKENAPRFPVGSVVDYEITFTNQYGNLGKLSKPEEGQGQQGSTKSYVDNTKGIRIGHAVTNAVNMQIALGGGDEQDIRQSIKNYAKMIFQISEDLNNEL